MAICCELQAVGTIGYWAALAQAGSVYLEGQERFQKSGYRNRYTILSAQGVQLLTIPVQGTREIKIPVQAIKIDNSRPWQQQHWRGLVSCYNKSPYFSLVSYRFEQLYTMQFEKLWDWNMAMLETIKQLLKLEVKIEVTQAYNIVLQAGITDRRSAEKPGNRDAVGAAQAPYIQVFGNTFITNLSVFDLIFNEGQAALVYLLRQKL